MARFFVRFDVIIKLLILDSNFQLDKNMNFQRRVNALDDPQTVTMLFLERVHCHENEEREKTREEK